MATKSKSKSRSKSKAKRKSPRTEKPTARNVAKANRKRKDNAEPGLNKVKAQPAPGPMPTNESLNPDSTGHELKLEQFQPGDEIAFWPLSATGADVPKGQAPQCTPFASATVREDRTVELEGMGKGKWVGGGPAGYLPEDRFFEFTIK